MGCHFAAGVLLFDFAAVMAVQPLQQQPLNLPSLVLYSSWVSKSHRYVVLEVCCIATLV